MKVLYKSATLGTIIDRNLKVYDSKKIGGQFTNKKDPIQYLLCLDKDQGKYKIQLETGLLKKNTPFKGGKYK